MPTRPDPRKPLLAYLRVQEDHDRVVRDMLRRAASTAEKAIKALPDNFSGRVRAQQLRIAITEMKMIEAELWTQVGAQIQADRVRAAAVASDVMVDYSATLLAVGLSKTEITAFRSAAKVTAERNVENAISRITLSKIPLSTQVFKTQALSSGQLDRVIENAIARGASARELAKDVKSFISPTVRGGASYAAQRLGRTELNNAFHATQARFAQENEFITGMRWMLSGSHPRPDRCDALAHDGHYPQGDAGVFKPGDVPPKPHPQCLCFMVPVMMDEEQFLTQVSESLKNL